MKKDIERPQVKNVGIAVIKEKNEEGVYIYNVYLINLGDVKLETILISSRGYGENKVTKEQIKTSTLRHALNDLEPFDFVKIEPIIEDVFGIHNEYLLSYFIGKQMYDKKFIFLAESITDENMISVPIINQKGVLIN